MKKLFTILSLSALVVGVNAQRQVGAPLLSIENPFKVSMDKAPFDTLTPPRRGDCSDSLLLYSFPASSGDDGYLFGTNSFGDLKKGQIFTNGTIGKVVAAFGYVVVVGNGSYTASIYQVSANLPTTLLGSSQASPASSAISLPTPGVSLLPFIFTTPVNIPATDFAVTVNVDGAAGDTIGLFSTPQNCGGNQSVEQWDDNSWHTILAEYGANFDIFLGVIVDRAGASISEANMPSAGIAPNPAVDFTMIGYNTKENGNVTIKITNLAGQTVMLLNEGAKQAGTYTRVIDVNTLAAGTYLYEVNCNGKAVNGRLVVAK